MELPLFVMIFVGIGGLVAGLIFWGLHVEKKRREAMQDFAASAGLDFYASAPASLQSKLSRFQLFNTGNGRKMTNVIQGQTEVASLIIFDYRYTVGGGKNKTTYNQTVVAMESDSLRLPSFTLRPEHMFDKIGSALGLQDIDFVQHPEFSKKYVLKGADESAIRAFFDQGVLDFFAAQTGISFECAPGMFIYYRASRPQKVDGLRAYLEEGYSVYQTFTERLARS